jgi:hypothetical protein
LSRTQTKQKPNTFIADVLTVACFMAIIVAMVLLALAGRY